MILQQILSLIIKPFYHSYIFYPFAKSVSAFGNIVGKAQAALATADRNINCPGMLVDYSHSGELAILPSQASSTGGSDGIGSPGNVQFVEDVGNVIADGFVADNQAFSNLGVAQLLGQ